MQKVLLDIGFYVETCGNSPSEILARHKGSWEHYPLLREHFHVVIVKFCEFEAESELNGLTIIYCKRPNIFNISKFLKKLVLRFQPGFVITHSFQFPFYNFVLQRHLSAESKLIVIPHGDQVSTKPAKTILQKFSYKKTSAVFFAGRQLAEPLVKAKIIPEHARIFEIMEGSSDMQMRNSSQATSKYILQLLWVGRLIEGKDPFCLLRALVLFKKEGAQFCLRLYYQNADLESQIRDFIVKEDLSKEVILCGFASRTELPNIYQQADVFLSSSLREGSGWAVCEAMSAGCWPILSNIPAHKFLSQHGACGTLFEVGDERSLLNALLNVQEFDLSLKSVRSRKGFEEKLSFQAIARDTLAALQSL